MAKIEDQLREAGRTDFESQPGIELPVHLRGVSRLREILDIPLDRIESDPDQPRTDFDEESLRRLASSLRTCGQVEEILVRWDAVKSRYILVSGERRWRAARLAGMRSLSACVVQSGLTKADLLAIQLLHNFQREKLTPIAQARAYKWLMEVNGWSGNQLAKRLCVSQSGVSHALRLLELPDEVRRQVERGDLTPSAAYEVSKLADPEEQVAVAAQVAARKISGKEVRDAVNERRGVKPAAGRAVFRDGPFVVVVQGPVDDEEALDAFLLEIADRLGVRRAG
jgi:ParB family transcriptional regulator, chromosome partitioning protein